MNRFQKFLFAVSLLLWLGGCSVADMAYNNAPVFVASELEDAFDLSEAQSEQLDSRLEQFFIWHRSEELNRYHEFLERAALDAADGITAAEFLTLRDDIGEAWERSVEKGIDSLGDIFANLTPEQIEQYQLYHRGGSQEYQDYLEKSVQQREIYRAERDFESLESWFGEFDFLLEEKITARLRQVPGIYQPWFNYREQRHQALLKAMKRGLTRQQLKTIMLDSSTDFSLAFAPAREAYWREYAAALEDISSWLSKQQRQRAVTRLQRFARVVERLRGQG
ncbi:MAG: hypothetical protein GY802_05095 [Gammaproteobacteria bacterium]|nr:hypothetical protein [Gammaproteobacteria bacterium]